MYGNFEEDTTQFDDYLNKHSVFIGGVSFGFGRYRERGTQFGKHKTAD